MCVLRTVGDAGPYNAIREHPYENQPKAHFFLLNKNVFYLEFYHIMMYNILV